MPGKNAEGDSLLRVWKWLKIIRYRRLPHTVGCVSQHYSNLNNSPNNYKRTVPLSTEVFCTVYDVWKVDLKKGYWNPKRKLWPYLRKQPLTEIVLKCMHSKCSPTILKWFSMNISFCWNALSTFQNALTVFSKCIINIWKCIEMEKLFNGRFR